MATLSMESAAQAGRVAVLMGGESAEREISLRSGAGVLAALKRCKVDAFAFDPAERPLQDLQSEGADCAFIVLHGRYGEDGTVQGALELLKIPYTGSGVMASSVAMDKILTKRIWISHGLPTPPFALLEKEADCEGALSAVGLPMAIKPSREGSSLGFAKVTDGNGLSAAFAQAHRFDDQVIAEAFVEGREFTCALLSDAQGRDVHALPVVEIVAPEGRYDYQHKYFGSETRYLCPAPVDSRIEALMRSISVRAFSALSCSGWARTDLIWDGASDPQLLEINTTPGMTDHSLMPMAAQQAGLSYDDLVLRILSTASLKVRGARP